jgi:3D (Asp-Asp-Asp) domain-containing protein
MNQILIGLCMAIGFMAQSLQTDNINPIREMLDSIHPVADYIEFEYIGEYFITAYCPSECGYNGENYPTGWQTASGEICHRTDYEDRMYEPTTCAIDRRHHSFGEMFYIEEFDRVFVAEDTGAFSGRWLDLFYEEYADVLYFPTGYYSTYSVEYLQSDPAEHFNINEANTDVRGKEE